jgi:hypothetical protein
VSSQLSAASGRLRARLGLALGLMAVLSVVIAGVLLSRGGHPRGEEVAAGVAGASRPTRDAGDPSVVVVPSPDAGVVLAVTEPSDAAPTASAAGAEPDAGSVAPPVVTPRSPAGARGARDARIVQATGKGTAFITASPLGRGLDRRPLGGHDPGEGRPRGRRSPPQAREAGRLRRGVDLPGEARRRDAHQAKLGESVKRTPRSAALLRRPRRGEPPAWSWLAPRRAGAERAVVFAAGSR